MYEDFSKSFYGVQSTDIPSITDGVGRFYALQFANDQLLKAAGAKEEDGEKKGDEEQECPGSKIRSEGKGQGLGRGKGKGPMGKPLFEKSQNNTEAGVITTAMQDNNMTPTAVELYDMSKMLPLLATIGRGLAGGAAKKLLAGKAAKGAIADKGKDAAKDKLLDAAEKARQMKSRIQSRGEDAQKVGQGVSDLLGKLASAGGGAGASRMI